MNTDSLIQLYCDVDDFSNELEVKILRQLLPQELQRRRRPGLSQSEMMTIIIAFQTSGYRTFKQFYLAMGLAWKNLFPKMPSYNRFVELMPGVAIQLYLFAMSMRGSVTGISFIDSTVLQVCKIKRAKRNKVFKNLATFGKSTIGWFFGFKLHLVINEIGELLAFKVTAGNVDDREPVEDLTKQIFGKIYGDKGYLSKELFEKLLDRGLQLVTNVKANMKNKLLPIFDKIMLRKRSVIETVNDQFKNVCQVEHTRHRSIFNFFINILAAIIAYSRQPKKPSINFDIPTDLGDSQCLPILI